MPLKKSPRSEVDGSPVTLNRGRRPKQPREPSLTPHMSEPERACFGRHLTGVARYLEFGCGGSTVWAARAGVKRIVSVESDPDWIAKCRKAPELKGTDASFVPIDIGETGAWGKPLDAAGAEHWPDYSAAGWDLLPAPPDLVFIDGRYRVACGLQAVLRIPPSAKLIVHDFWNRPSYYELLNFCDVVEHVDTLAVLSPRQHVDWKALALIMPKYVMDWR